MHPAPHPRRRWRRTALVAAGVSLIAAVAPMVGANPASAAPAPLVTEDGVGIRVDENALLGPAIEAIETELQPFVNQMIYDGAIANSPAGTPKSTHVTSNLELGFDFVNAGTAGYPQGGLKVHADILGIEIRYIKDPVWPFADCSIWVRPDTATIDASAYIDSSKLPGAPLTLNPIDAYWDDDPSVDYSGVCWWWLIDDFFDDIFGSGSSGSIADNIETELNAEAQELIDQLWNDYVTPVIDSLAGFGITFGQIRTDDEGLIVTADVNATNGLTIPGLPGGPYNVSSTEDAGVTHDVNTVLAQTNREVIATIHPNVVSQFMNALNQGINSQYGQYATSSAIESVLLPPAVHGAYADAGWTLRLTALAAPQVDDTGTGGRPQLAFPNIEMRFYNTSKGPFAPVATFRGTLGALDLLTVVNSTTGTWGPTFSSANATLGNLTRTQANVDAATLPVQAPSAILPAVKVGFDNANTDLIIEFISLPPLSIGGLSISLCTGCGRLSGDQRYTEYFNVA